MRLLPKSRVEKEFANYVQLFRFDVGEYNNYFGKKLKDIRVERGMPIITMAKLLNVPSRLLQCVEEGLLMPNVVFIGLVSKKVTEVDSKRELKSVNPVLLTSFG